MTPVCLLDIKFQRVHAPPFGGLVLAVLDLLFYACICFGCLTCQFSQLFQATNNCILVLLVTQVLGTEQTIPGQSQSDTRIKEQLQVGVGLEDGADLELHLAHGQQVDHTGPIANRVYQLTQDNAGRQVLIE